MSRRHGGGIAERDGAMDREGTLAKAFGCPSGGYIAAHVNLIAPALLFPKSPGVNLHDGRFASPPNHARRHRSDPAI